MKLINMLREMLKKEKETDLKKSQTSLAERMVPLENSGLLDEKPKQTSGVDIYNFQIKKGMTRDEIEKMEEKIMAPNPEGEYIDSID